MFHFFVVAVCSAHDARFSDNYLLFVLQLKPN